MGGGLMQLVASGAQDVYISGNPQITFFKVVYRRHTNFSIESIEQTLNGTVSLGNKVSCTVSRNGDLMHRVYLEVDLTNASTASNYGHSLLNSIEVEIGGQRIDRHTGEWLHVWNELTQEEGKKQAYKEMIGNVSGSGARTLYIPLQFWFCRNAGLALPLIALQYHEVKFNIDFNSELSNIVEEKSYELSSVSSGTLNLYENGHVGMTFTEGHDYQVGDIVHFDGDVDMNGVKRERVITDIASNGFTTHTYPSIYEDPLWALHGVNNVEGQVVYKVVTVNMNVKSVVTKAKLFVDYIYLDTDERRRFAQISHEYLIEQLQMMNYETLRAGMDGKFELNFNHPVKCLIWTVKNAANNQDFSFQSHAKCKLQLNGHERFAPRDGKYFSLVQPYQHMPNIPDASKPIHMYSFSLKPAEHQPSGTCNMSRIDNASLTISSDLSAEDGDQSVNVYAINYNVLRIMSGMGGLAFSN